MSALKDIFDELALPCIKWSHYFDIYEKHFSKFVNKSPVIVEVGIYSGGSAELWKKYFGPGATIVGIDINPAVSQYKTDGCIQVIGDQGSPEFWAEFLKTYPQIDVFIDDGSHMVNHQITTLQSAWGNINYGGVYLCEDTHSNYWAEFGGSLNRPSTFLSYAKQVTDAMNADYLEGIDRNPNNMAFGEMYKDVGCMYFYDSIVVLDKEPKHVPQWVQSDPKLQVSPPYQVMRNRK
jgi:hypothetical protein